MSKLRFNGDFIEETSGFAEVTGRDAGGQREGEPTSRAPQTKFTPGPWAVRPKRYLDTRRRVGPVDNEFFDVSYSSGNSNQESEANARLIAQSPMLLFYLKQLHGHCDRECCDVCVAIQRAEGRES